MAIIALLSQAPSGSFWNTAMQFLPLVAIFAVFYLLLIVPARKRQKAHEAMIKAISSGDKVITNGGLIGTVTHIEDKNLKVRLAPGVEVTILRTHIAGKAGEESA